MHSRIERTGPEASANIVACVQSFSVAFRFARKWTVTFFLHLIATQNDTLFESPIHGTHTSRVDQHTHPDRQHTAGEGLAADPVLSLAVHPQKPDY